MNQNYIMKFGKYKEKDLLYIMEYNPKYITWLLSLNDLKDPLKTILSNLVETQYFKDCLEEYIENERMYLAANDPNF